MTTLPALLSGKNILPLPDADTGCNGVDYHRTLLMPVKELICDEKYSGAVKKR
jgi:hypothetical protein